MSEALEHREHVQEATERGRKHAALVIAVLAALLAITDQQGKRAEIATQEASIGTADAWAEYQAKSIRAAVSEDFARLVATFDAPADPALATKRADLVKRFADDRQHFETDPATGKSAIAARARALEAERQRSFERAHTLDYAAAAMQLGIVLATASIITASVLLIRFAYVMGTLGAVLAILATLAPGLIPP
jgi:hypothetical protein